MSRFSLRPIRQDGVKANDRKCESENQYQYWVNTFERKNRKSWSLVILASRMQVNFSSNTVKKSMIVQRLLIILGQASLMQLIFHP